MERLFIIGKSFRKMVLHIMNVANAKQLVAAQGSHRHGFADCLKIRYGAARREKGSHHEIGESHETTCREEVEIKNTGVPIERSNDTFGENARGVGQD